MNEFSAQAAKSKRSSEDEPMVAPMRPSTGIRRSPSTDQKKVRRALQRGQQPQRRTASNNEEFPMTRPQDTSRQREAQILQAMALASPSEQERLSKDLDALRTARRTASRRTEEARIDSVVEHTLSPVHAYVRHTASTDWVDGTQAGDPSIAMKREASKWFNRTSAELRADADEFSVQAVGMARRVASAHGESARVAERAFLDQVDHLYRTAEDASINAQNGDATSSVTDYSKLAPVTLDTAFSEGWASKPADGVHPPMSGAGDQSATASRRTAADDNYDVSRVAPSTLSPGDLLGWNYSVVSNDGTSLVVQNLTTGDTISQPVVNFDWSKYASRKTAAVDVNDIISYESGEMSEDDTVKFFQGLIDSGVVWSLQGSYGRTATSLIDAGVCHAAGTTATRKTGSWGVFLRPLNADGSSNMDAQWIVLEESGVDGYDAQAQAESDPDYDPSKYEIVGAADINDPRVQSLITTSSRKVAGGMEFGYFVSDNDYDGQTVNLYRFPIQSDIVDSADLEDGDDAQSVASDLAADNAGVLVNGPKGWLASRKTADKNYVPIGAAEAKQRYESGQPIAAAGDVSWFRDGASGDSVGTWFTKDSLGMPFGDLLPSNGGSFAKPVGNVTVMSSRKRAVAEDGYEDGYDTGYTEQPYSALSDLMSAQGQPGMRAANSPEFWQGVTDGYADAANGVPAKVVLPYDMDSRYASRKRAAMKTASQVGDIVPCLNCGQPAVVTDPNWGTMQYCPACTAINAAKAQADAAARAGRTDDQMLWDTVTQSGAPIVNLSSRKTADLTVGDDDIIPFDDERWVIFNDMTQFGAGVQIKPVDGWLPGTGEWTSYPTRDAGMAAAQSIIDGWKAPATASKKEDRLAAFRRTVAAARKAEAGTLDIIQSIWPMDGEAGRQFAALNGGPVEIYRYDDPSTVLATVADPQAAYDWLRANSIGSVNVAVDNQGYFVRNAAN